MLFVQDLIAYCPCCKKEHIFSKEFMNKNYSQLKKGCLLGISCGNEPCYGKVFHVVLDEEQLFQKRLFPNRTGHQKRKMINMNMFGS